MFGQILMILAVVLVLIIVLLWAGLRVPFKPFAPYPARGSAAQTVPLPGGLPAPLERFYRKIYGERVPLIESAVMTGKVTVRPVGPVAFPGRFRITHVAG